jgi:hypothetical protein
VNTRISKQIFGNIWEKGDFSSVRLCPTVYSYDHIKYYYVLFYIIDCIVRRIKFKYEYKNE